MNNSMNINNLNSGISMPPQQQGQRAQNLSADQQALISETLSEFDPENLTESDAQSIIETFSEAGIQPSSTLGQAMEELGFDARTVGDLANAEQAGNRPPPPPPPSDSGQSTEEISSLVDYFTELMEQKLAESNDTELSDSDKLSILDQLYDKFGIESGTSMINTKV